jgi:hypothetical protein
MEDVKGYCCVCKKLVVMKNAKAVVLKGGQRVWTGVCPNDGTEILKRRD